MSDEDARALAAEQTKRYEMLLAAGLRARTIRSIIAALLGVAVCAVAALITGLPSGLAWLAAGICLGIPVADLLQRRDDRRREKAEDEYDYVAIIDEGLK